VLICYSLSHFLCRKILTCTFSLNFYHSNTRRTILLSFTNFSGASALLHAIHFSFNNEIRLKLHCFLSDIFNFIIKERYLWD
jgi:hypothetical protein